MHDLFLAHVHEDAPAADALAAALCGRGLTAGPPLVIRPDWPLIASVDERLVGARFGVVLISTALLRMGWSRRDLDALALRRRVVPLLHGLGERDVARHSPRLAVAAVPEALADRLARRLGRPGG